MNKHCVYHDYTIEEVMSKFEYNKERVAVVLNNEDVVVGVVSQGDIIKALVDGVDMYSNIKNIISPSFLYLTSTDMNEAYRMFRRLKITMIPIVDANFRLQNIITLDDIYDYLDHR